MDGPWRSRRGPLLSVIACVALGVSLACGSSQSVTTGGSVHLSNSHAPNVDVGHFIFSGAVTGTGVATHESCEIGGSSPYQYFTVTALGDSSGRQFFLSVTIYPYRGADAYEMRTLPGRPMDYPATPDPLVDNAPGAYPAFLNFVPKSDPGNAFASSRDVASAMAVDDGQSSGWFDLRLVAANQKAGPPANLKVLGRFLCGPPFQL